MVRRLYSVHTLLTVLSCLLGACPCAALAADARPAAQFFRTRIEPVLKKHCYQCHSGRGEAKGELQLDGPKLLRRGGESGAVVAPGKPTESLLLSALRHEDLKMPPKQKLPAEVIADFETWIRDGAVDPRDDVEQEQHWAFQPIRRPRPPVVSSAWPRTDLDHFILKRLQQAGIEPSPEASPATLLRRVHLDLTGLPPTPDEVTAFLDDPSDQAYEAIVDRLISSPHYGERWGRYWLDMARYADSNGYESDRQRPHAWRWREWVINALNADMPFDQFTIEQIAGDLLPNATVSQRVATGFHRNTLVNTEGGVDREEDRVKRTVDRTNTIGKVWLGLTLGCCQCHSHKYDPISQHEYYSLYAFFNSLNEPLIEAPSPRDFEHYEQQRATFVAEHQKYLNRIRNFSSETMAEWERSLPTGGDQWEPIVPEKLATARTLDLHIEDDGSVGAYGINNQSDTYTIVTTPPLQRITAIRLEALADVRLGANGPGLASNGNFVMTTFRVFAAAADDEGKGERQTIATAHADFSQGGHGIELALNESAKGGWAIYPEVGKDHTAIFELETPIEGDDVERLTFEMSHQMWTDHNIGRFRISVTDAPRPVPRDLNNADITRTLNTPPEQRTVAQVLRLVQAFDYSEPELDKLIQAAAEHRKQAPLAPTTTALARAVEEMPDPRETRVHLRGDFLSKGDVVQRRAPSVLPRVLVRGDSADRVDLARWLVNDDNPLTARVIVNRIWQQYFGRGLVVSDDDFGTQGELPTHPELLDWLASRFRDDGWSLKKLHKLIVTSATYRQSSHVRPKLLESDPYNTLLARQNRLRVEAEIVRDLALSASGLLTTTVGGQSVRPPQPANLVSLGFQKSVSWPVSEGGDRYRRGVYTFFQRTVPYPMLVDFDAADSNASCTRRDRSTTPLQALTMWNDPVFVECAEHLGRRIVADTPAGDVQERLRYAVRLALSREASEPELADLERYYAERKMRLKSDEAAWFSVARLLINLDEFITRE